MSGGSRPSINIIISIAITIIIIIIIIILIIPIHSDCLTCLDASYNALLSASNCCDIFPRSRVSCCSCTASSARF